MTPARYVSHRLERAPRAAVVLFDTVGLAVLVIGLTAPARLVEGATHG